MFPRFSHAAPVLVFLTGACVTSGEGDKMKADIDRLRERVEAMDRRDAEINEQVARLRKVLDEATHLLQRNSADLGTKVAQNETTLANLTGQLEEAKHLAEELQKRVNEMQSRLGGVEQTQGKIIDKVAPTIPEDKETLWRDAQARLNGGQREDARRFFRSFIQRFPQDARAPQAQIFLGQSFALEGKHTQAATEFQKVLDSYGKSAEVPEAMWLLAQSFVELKFCSDARVILQDLERRYPRSGRVKDAKVKLRELQRIGRDKRHCTSSPREDQPGGGEGRGLT
jgi:tol-pal system protein YbgF